MQRQDLEDLLRMDLEGKLMLLPRLESAALLENACDLDHGFGRVGGKHHG